MIDLSILRQGGSWIYKLVQIVNDHSASYSQGLGSQVLKVSSDWAPQPGCPESDFSPSEPPLPHPCQIGFSYLFFVIAEHLQATWFWSPMWLGWSERKTEAVKNQIGFPLL